jgi:hypothetical protein
MSQLEAILQGKAALHEVSMRLSAAKTYLDRNHPELKSLMVRLAMIQAEIRNEIIGGEGAGDKEDLSPEDLKLIQQTLETFQRLNTMAS